MLKAADNKVGGNGTVNTDILLWDYAVIYQKVIDLCILFPPIFFRYTTVFMIQTINLYRKKKMKGGKNLWQVQTTVTY